MTMVKSSSRPVSKAARSATQEGLQRRGPHRLRAALKPAASPAAAVRGRIAGLSGISGGLAAAASPRIVPSRLRASRATRRETPVRAGMRVLPRGDLLAAERAQFVSGPGRADESAGSGTRGCPRCWGRRPAVASHRSIHSLTVIFLAFGSGPAVLAASWIPGRGPTRARRPGSRIRIHCPPCLKGSLYFTRHGFGPCRASPRKPSDGASLGVAAVVR